MVAAASDLQFALPELSARFERQTGNVVKLTFGSSGNFANQIKNGAPFDLFFSADSNYPKALEAAGLVEPNTLYYYANGKIVLWTKDPAKFDVSKGARLLLEPGIHKVAIANPQHAPYGRAAIEALKHEGVYEKLESKLVLGENISQTAQFVESGSADAGIVAMSLVVAPMLQGHGAYYEIPTRDYSPIEQVCVVLKASSHKQVARQFLEFVKQPQARDWLGQHGFTLPAIH